MTKNTPTRIVILTLFIAAGIFSAMLWSRSVLFPVCGVAVFALFNVFPSFVKRPDKKLRISSDGADLLTAFLALVCIECVLFPFYANYVTGWFSSSFWICFAIIFTADLTVFWNGIIRVYATSSIIGAKWRIIGIICGMIPIAHIFVLIKIIGLVRFDVKTEEDRKERNDARAADKVCKTKYPIIFVHGVFFRDIRFFNYWGRIPKELEKNGATIYYGEQQSALGVAESAAEISERIKKIINETGCEKVNIIAHSKGGLDSRYAITHLGLDRYVASLTTINTPHRGCEFADWLFAKASEGFKNKLSAAYNSTLRKLGDRSPDFLSSVKDLCASECKKLNETTPDAPNVFYQSTASKINKPLRNIPPLCFTSAFVKRFDGPNDGLVSITSAKWGEKVTVLQSNSPEGISHADMIDMSRHNRKDIDILEFYVELVSDLKKRGY